MEKPKIKVTCKGAIDLPLDELRPLQGGLKSLSQKSFQRLRKSLIRYGITYPFHVWESSAEFFILDGHQRDMVLRTLQAEGWTLPLIPCTLIQAKDKKEASEKILVISGTYGEMTNESLESFLSEHDLIFSELEGELVLPDIDLDFFSDPDFEPASENDQGRLDRKGRVTCPNCGHEFVP